MERTEAPLPVLAGAKAAAEPRIRAAIPSFMFGFKRRRYDVCGCVAGGCPPEEKSEATSSSTCVRIDWFDTKL